MRDASARSLAAERPPLTIAVPTFNRARHLDTQLEWLAGAIRGFEHLCEILISDNSSTDSTPSVIDKWREKLSGASLTVNRHGVNVGAIRNIAYCIRSAKGKHVWTIGDDDRIGEQTLAYVMDTLTANPDLGLLTLNFSARHAKTGELQFERCFSIDEEAVAPSGKALFERCLEENYGGLALTTAQVYRTDLAHRALQRWEAGLRNLAVQVYWTGFCALNGSTIVTKDAHLECAVGTHFFLLDPKLHFKLDCADRPEVYAKLMEIGCSPELCRKLVFQQFRLNKKRILFSARRWPGTVADVLLRYALAAARVARVRR